MEALAVDEIPAGGEWQYEPKWDGFRCLAFRDGDEVYLQSKSGQPLTRYFPEMVAALTGLKPKRFVLDGELAIPVRGTFSFDDLLQRIHPAESRVRKLAREFPAIFIVFDLLVKPDGTPMVDKDVRQRRAALVQFARAYLQGNEQVRLSPATTDFETATEWFNAVGANLDGLIAKRVHCPYKSGERTGMEKIKKLRTADCVVGGFRYAEKDKALGSLLLGLYNEAGLLDHVGFCSGFKASERKQLIAKVEPLVEPPGFTGRSPGGLSRWSTKRSMEWQPLRPELVVEVSYDHFTGGRFRHGTRLLRWRPDKEARQCKMDQVANGKAENGPMALLSANASAAAE